MKKLFRCLCTAFGLCILSFSLNAQGVIWENCTFNEALQKAKSENKLVFLDCYTSWCGPCKAMTTNVFPLKEAGDYFNTCFINIKIDMEKGEGIELSKKFNIVGYPTFIVLHPDGKEVGRIVGGGTLNEFIAKVEYVKDIQNSSEYLYDKYLKFKGINDAYKYLNTLESGKEDVKIRDFLEKHFDELPIMDRLTLRTWSYIPSALSLSEPTFLIKILDIKDQLDRSIGKPIIDYTLSDALVKLLSYNYLTKHEEVDSTIISKVCSTIQLIYNQTYYALLVVDLAKAYSNNDIELFKKKLSRPMMGYFMTPIEIMYVLDIIKNSDKLNEDEKALLAANIKDFNLD